MAWLSYGTLDAAIARILHIKDYTTFETTKVVFLMIFFVSPLISHLIMIYVAPRW